MKKPANKIEKLIAEMCPDGVEFKALGDVMTIVRGASPRPIRSFLTDDKQGINWIKIGDVDHTAKYVTKAAQMITKKGAAKSRFLKKGDFILSNSMSFGRPYILEIEGCIHDGWVAMSDFEKSFISDFLYYLLRSKIVQKYWQQKASSGTVQNLNADIVRNTQIPIPPLAIQKEIVKILDNFTELEAELEARKKQYEYYRDKLLSFDDGVEFKALGEVGKLVGGSGLPKSDFTDSGVACIHYGQIYTHYGMHTNRTISFVSDVSAERLKKVNRGDLIIAKTSENVPETLVFLGCFVVMGLSWAFGYLKGLID